MPHHSTRYTDAAYCYGPTSVVCRSVGRSVGLSVCHTSEPCKNSWTDWHAIWVEDSGGPREPCIRWQSRSLMGRGNFDREKKRPVVNVKYRDTLQSSVQEWLNRLRCRSGCGLGWPQGIMCWMGVQIPHAEVQFWGKAAPIVKYRDFLPWAVQKRLNRSIYRLGCGLGWADRRKHKFSHIRQVMPMCPSSIVFASWRQWTIRVRRCCGLMSNYFDHLLSLLLTVKWL